MLKSLVFALAALPTAILAQGAASIPACALTCVTSSFAGTPCTSVANLTCICSDTTFQAAFLGCQMRTCSAAELTSAIAFGTSQCAALGITLPPLPSNATGSSTAAVSSSAAAAASSTVASTAATSSAVATGTSTASSTARASSAASGVSSAASSAAATATAAPRSDAQSLAFGGLAGSIALGLALLV